MIRILCLDISQAGPSGYEKLYAAASSERKARADRCLRREDALRCVAAEALLRLAVHRSLPGQPVTVLRDGYGKPYLKEHPEFAFNLSHCGTWVVLAWGGRVGIDVEKLRTGGSIEKLARRHFTLREQESIFAAEETWRPWRFLAIWTAKESYLKYRGTGLTEALDRFDVLTMDDPRFFRQRLAGDYCMTVCAGEEPQKPEFLTITALLAALAGEGEA